MKPYRLVALAIVAAMVAATFACSHPPINLRNSPRIPDLKNATALNWAGYYATDVLGNPTPGMTTAVQGGWRVPSVACGFLETSNSASWVGLDGIADGTIQQVGTKSNCVLGTRQYGAWYEFYPGGPVAIPMTTHPGDIMLADVFVDVPTKTFTLNLSDTTTHATFSVRHQQPDATLTSAEWITEAPSSFLGVLPLAPFGTEQWGRCYATIQGILAPIGDDGYSRQEDVLVMTNGTIVKAQPSPLANGGTQFSIQWEHH